MQCSLPAVLALAVGLAACHPDAKNADEATAAQKPPTPLPVKDSTYCRLEILDAGFDNMVAFTLNVPRDWQVAQTIKREWYGKMPLVQVSITMRSPDGRQQIDYLPSQQYAYQEGAPNQGTPLPMQPTDHDYQTTSQAWQQMTPATYLRRHLLPRLATQNLTLRDTNNFRLPPPHAENGRPVATASLDGTLPNGHAARIEVRLSQRSERSDKTVSHMWSAVPSITQAAGNLPATYAHTQVAQQSIVPNPEWLRLLNEPVADSLPARIDRHRIINWYRMPTSNTKLYYQYQYWLHRNETWERREMETDHHFRAEAQ